MANEKLDNFIIEQAAKTFIEGLEITPERRIEALGVAISQWSDWDGERILDVAIQAFDDANFHTLAAFLDEHREALLDYDASKGIQLFPPEVEMIKCPKCLGEGEYVCPEHEGNEAEAKGCDNPDCENGRIGCEECKGLGEIPAPKPSLEFLARMKQEASHATEVKEK